MLRFRKRLRILLTYLKYIIICFFCNFAVEIAQGVCFSIMIIDIIKMIIDIIKMMIDIIKMMI